jgi:diguanylate cyclase (GGDEF)-like protein
MEQDLEAQRLAALDHLDVLDSPPEESFDRITRLVRTVLDTPIATITLIDRNRQWFKSRQGLDNSETPRDISFCALAIEQSDPLIVADARKDPRFRDNPLVLGDPKIRFYMGVPLVLSDGFAIGTLCAIDRRPRQMRREQVATMYDLARVVVDELELRRLATVDTLTGALTRRTFLREAEQAFDVARQYKREFSCVMMDVDLGAVVETRGRAAADAVLRAISRACRKAIRSVDLFGRVAAEEFALALPETDQAGAETVAERLRWAVGAAVGQASDGPLIDVTASLGVAVQGGLDRDFASLMHRADTAMFRAKQGGRNQVVIAGAGFGLGRSVRSTD